MKNKIIIMMLLATMLLAGCGKSKNYNDGGTPNCDYINTLSDDFHIIYFETDYGAYSDGSFKGNSLYKLFVDGKGM